MAHDPLIGEPPETPPPLPARSPLRDNPHYKCRRRWFQAEMIDECTNPSSPVSQAIFDELGLELEDTQHRLVTAIYESNKVHSLQGSKHPREGMLDAENGTLSKRSEDDECTALEFLTNEAEAEANWSNNLSTGSRKWSKTSSAYNQSIKEDQEEHTILGDEHLKRLPSSHCDGSSEPSTATSSFEGGCALSWTHSTEVDEDARAEGWLARGLPNAKLPAAEQSRQFSRDRYDAKYRALSPFPPVSPRTGNREYDLSTNSFTPPTCPVSPLNNGRDAYGNYISSNIRDHFAAPCPPGSPTPPHLSQNQRILEQGEQQPQVHLRGGWELPKPFWRRSSNVEPSQEHKPTNGLERDDKGGPMEGLRSVNKIEDRQHPGSRAVPSMRPQNAADPRTNLPTENRTSLKPDIINERYDGVDDAGDYGIYGTNSHGLHQQQTYEPPDENPYDNLSFIFNKHFGIQASPPILVPSGTRRLATEHRHRGTYRHEDSPVQTGSRSPPIYATRALPNTPNALQTFEYPTYRPMSPRDRENRPSSPESQRTATTIQSLTTTPREGKRWDSEIPRTPPKEPAPGFSQEADPYLVEHMNSQDTESIFSTRTADDRLKGFVELQTSGPYRKAKQAREARRIYEEQRRRREAEYERDTDLHTITPSMSASQRQVRRQPPPRTSRVQRMGRVPENESYHSFKRDVPGQNSHDQLLRQHPQPSDAGTVVLEPARNEKSNMNSMEMAFHIAGKVTRFLLATPSDPKSKTYSKRYQPAEDQRRGKASMRMNTSVLERISDGASSQIQETRGLKDSNKKQDKGKGKAVDLDATAPKRDFTPRVNHDFTLSGSTAINNNARFTGNTLGGPSTARYTSSGLRNERDDRFAVQPAPDKSNIPGTNHPYDRGGKQYDTQYEESDTGTTWPDPDEQGNVIISHNKGGMRGGGSDEFQEVRSSFSAGSSLMEKKTKKEKKQKSSAWTSCEYAMALHALR
ncbi:uncharacterized protein K460DRAFT_350011 [Cucurbitaria berberidis CBS 394.84]|uniref:Uncharacterized protein n=1 Tax=Cucurbitaria berberidis CBS 394.84 TaxID=1168544 RepID=A0A9P4GQE8_9PLEO|nr:uncharacterized protein K460DRAFT_350011 [Cucurbitaria berberidis CBS 394.84]KAF1849872.1 hypothetical protein K460DRAFT_350011 [Cucurbitaria berberidis CBS 394.84]